LVSLAWVCLVLVSLALVQLNSSKRRVPMSTLRLERRDRTAGITESTVDDDRRARGRGDTDLERCAGDRIRCTVRLRRSIFLL
jgi:hypothetical protein